MVHAEERGWLQFGLYLCTGNDRAFNVKQTSDGGFIAAGFTASSDGDVVALHTGGEAWIVKLDADGNKLWATTYGGSAGDTAYAIMQVTDDGYIVCGSAASSGGDVPGNAGSSDGWVFKTDASGSVIWTKNFGGSGQDVLNRIVPVAGGAYILSGYTFSNNGDISGNHGNADMWVIKIDGNGNLIWSNVFGGSADDAGLGLQAAGAGGVFVTGTTESNDGQVSNQASGSDIWTIRVDDNGALLWQKCAGTVKNEYGCLVMSARDDEFVVTGFAEPLTQPNGRQDPADGLLVKFGYANTIRGTIYLDANSNGIKDAGEHDYNYALVHAQKTGYIRSAMPYQGLFNIDVDTGSYTTTVQSLTAYFNIVPTSKNTVFTGYYNVDSFSFAAQPIANKQDLIINLVPVNVPRPGFDIGYRILYKNFGATDIPSGQITLQKDSRQSFVAASPAPISVSDNSITWSYSNVNIGDTAGIQLILKNAAPPALNAGDTIRLVATIDPVSGDETPADDTAVLKQWVVKSYDPNDKTEANAGVITPAQVNDGDFLHYTIRFQNTGADTAFTVVVRDTFDNRLDWGTFQMIGASHAYQLSIEDNNKLSWQFNNILLPDRNVNETASHGYIAYRIRPNTTVMVGDTIKNTAGIYFDFNLPVPTNTDKTVVLSLVATPLTLVSLRAVLNDAEVDVKWTTADKYNLSHFEVQRSANGIDFTGIGTVQPGRTTYLFKDHEPLTGYNYYRLKSVDIDGTIHLSPAAIVNVGNENSIIAAIYPNSSNGRTVHVKLRGAVQEWSGYRCWTRWAGPWYQGNTTSKMPETLKPG